MSYPFKRFQQNYQDIDISLLADFLTNEMEKKIKLQKSYYCEVVDSDNLLAIFLIEPMDLHSKIYGKKMFRISVLVNYKLPRTCINLFWNELRWIIHKENIQRIFCRVDSSEHENILSLTFCGFKSYGLSDKMVLKLENREIKHDVINDDFVIRNMIDNDKSSISNLAQEHDSNRYLCDPSLPIDKSKKLFSEYILNQNNNLYVLEDKKTKNVVGFINYQNPKLFNQKLNKNIVILDIIIISRDLRGKNYGKYLFESSLRDILQSDRFNQVELRVDHDNRVAINFYQSLGFKIVCSDMRLSYSF